MARNPWFATLAGALLTVAVVAPTTAANAAVPAHRAAPVAVRSATLTTAQFEAKLLSLTNARRKKVGCSAVKSNAALTKAARAHSALMVKKRNLSHQLPGELGLAVRIVKAGYKKWTGLAENIAWGGTTPAQVFSMWMNSSGHRANIQHCSYHDAGFGVVRGAGSTWVTLDLGSHR